MNARQSVRYWRSACCVKTHGPVRYLGRDRRTTPLDGSASRTSIAAIDDRYDDEFTVKLDHNLWSGHRLFLRSTWSHPWFIDVVNNADARFPGQPHGTQGGRRWSYSIGSDWTINPRMVNELRVGYKFYS